MAAIELMNPIRDLNSYDEPAPSRLSIATFINRIFQYDNLLASPKQLLLSTKNYLEATRPGRDLFALSRGPEYLGESIFSLWIGLCSLRLCSCSRTLGLPRNCENCRPGCLLRIRIQCRARVFRASLAALEAFIDTNTRNRHQSKGQERANFFALAFFGEPHILFHLVPNNSDKDSHARYSSF